jgi:SsrA-binding protein
MSAEASEKRAVATNRRARFDYEVIERVEAGLVLVGPEVKSLRAGKASLGESYAMIRRGEAWLLNCHISPYDPASRENPDPRRERKLLLHRKELRKLEGKLQERGVTMVPLSLYFKDGRAKVELALVRGKRRFDKRATIRDRESQRDLARRMRGRGHS